MGIFSSIVKTVVETVTLPVAVAKDAFSLGNEVGRRSHTETKLRRIKQAADDKEEYEMDETEDLMD